MAVDLRAIVSSVKITTDLERVGELAINIAQRMLRDALDVYVSWDVIAREPAAFTCKIRSG